MPPIIPDAPWWANVLIIVLGLAATTTATVWVAQIGTRRRLDQTQADVGEVKEQVKNTHVSNLRDDVDELKSGLSHVKRGQEDQGRFLRDLDRSIRALGHSLDRRDALQTEALKAAVEDRQREIAEALHQHVAGCPARNQAPEKEN